MIRTFQAITRGAVLFLVGVSATVSSRAQVANPTFANPTVHDPSVIRDGGTFYVFGSHLASASTTDLMHWTQITRDWSATTNPTCVLIRNNSPITEFSEALNYTVPPDFWAPDVIKLGDGRYYLYYCVCNGTSKAALGIAVADTVTGPYANIKIMLESGMPGLSPDGTPYNNAVHPNCVDPSVFFDQTGKLWMVYGSFSGGIFVLSLDPSTGQPFPGQAYGKRVLGGNNARIEGAYIIYSPDSAYYYLFCTFGGLDAAGGYNIRVGRSRNPDGPFLDAAGNDLVNVKGAIGTVFDDASIAPFGVKLMGNYQFLHVAGEPQATSRGYLSPGGTSAYYDPATGKYFLVFHTRFVGRGEQHEVRVHQFFISEDGWPVVAPQRYAGETIAATAAGQVVGDFKLINHGKAISAAVNSSVVVTLNADGTVSGPVTGSWQLSGGRYATLTLGGTVYRGVFARLWDDDNQVYVLTFSALSTGGVSVWGSKVAALNVDVPPTISSQPTSQTVASGGTVVFSVEASGSPTPTYQWQLNGAPIAGATSSLLLQRNLSAAAAGNYTCVVSNSAGSVISDAAVLAIATTTDVGKLTALSIRGLVGTGGDIMIAGMVVEGSTVKTIIQGVGPTLGIVAPDLAGSVLVNPNLEIYQSTNTGFVRTQVNDDWGGSPALTAAAIATGATQLTNPASKDSALLTTLSPGIYTANINGVGGTTGIALVQAYAVPSPTDTGTLSALSIRGRVGTGGDVLIAGIVISGSTSKTLLIQAVGPTLGIIAPDLANSVLTDPKLELYRIGNGATKIRTNDDWGGDAQINTIAAATGGITIANPASKDSSLLVTLPPGVYTANVSGVNNTAGVVLLQAYSVP